MPHKVMYRVGGFRVVCEASEELPFLLFSLASTPVCNARR